MIIRILQILGLICLVGFPILMMIISSKDVENPNSDEAVIATLGGFFIGIFIELFLAVLTMIIWYIGWGA